MLPSHKKINEQFKPPIDEKFQTMDDIIKSPLKAPQKRVEKVHTKIGDLKIENMAASKKRLQMKLNLMDESDLIEVFCVRFDPDDTLLASSFSDGLIKIFNINTGKLTLTLNGSLYNTPTTIMRWRPRGGSSKTKNILLTGNSDGNLTHWHTSSGKEIRRIVEEDNQILSLDYNLDGTSFATAGKDLKIRIYDEETAVVVNTLESIVWANSAHANRIFSLKFLGDNPNVLLSGGWDANIFLWDVREKTNFGSIYGPALSGDALDYKKGVILTGSHRNQEQLQLWDFSKREKIQDVNWEYGKRIEGVNIYGAQFCKVNDESIFAGCGGKNEVKMFDLKDDLKVNSAILGLKKGIYSVDYGNSTNRVAFGGADGISYVMAITSF